MRPHWVWPTLVGGLILGLPAGALFFISVPVLTVTDVKAGQQLFAVQVRAGDSFILSYRHPVTQSPISGTFEVEGDGRLSVKETTVPSPGAGLSESRLGEAELSFFVHPFTHHTLVVKRMSLNLSRKVQSGSLIKIRVERRFWWWAWSEKAGALLSVVRWRR